MIDNKKAQEHGELHRMIWSMANDLRSSVDGWDFKQYVLGILFYRYISENFERYVDNGESEAGESNFVYANREEKEYVSKLVSNYKIGENDYNLSVSSYVDSEDTREVIDINVLNKEISEIVEKEQILRDEINKIIAEIEV